MNRRTALLTLTAGLTKSTIEAAAVPLHIVDIKPVMRLTDVQQSVLKTFEVPASVVVELRVTGFDILLSDGRTLHNVTPVDMDEAVWRLLVDWMDNRMRQNATDMIERGEVLDITGGVE